ncbi:hypothetical protein GCM10011408_05680 [Dyella caseinilytica]|nr:hypothetical protein GCM10011408_05680 [Dyella caseinilytica]
MDCARLFSASVKPVVLTHSKGLTAPTIEISSGVEFCSGEYASANNYIPHVPVPLEDWKVCATEDFSGDLNEVVNSPYTSVGIFAVPSPIREEIEQLNKVTSDADDYLHLAKTFARYVVPHFHIVPQSFFSHALVVNEPGERTTTIDTRTMRRPGLHVDSWSDGEGETRFASKIRFNVNLGPGRRAFLFASKGLAPLGDWDGSLEPDAYYNFLRFAPNTKIYRVTLDPGMAYIAATECLIHDATTSMESTRRCISYQLRGRLYS